MKRSITIALLLIIIMGVATVATAGTLGDVAGGIKEWLFENAMGALLTATLTIVGGFFGGTAWGKHILKARAPLYEAKDVAQKLYNARLANSPGGEQITAEEWDAILKEGVDVIDAFVQAFGEKPVK